MFKEMFNKLNPTWYKVITFIAGFIMFIQILVSFGDDNYTLGIYYVLLLVLIFGMYFFSMKYHLIKLMKKLDETYGKRELLHRVEFDDNGAIITNLESGAVINMSYSSMSRMCNIHKGIVIMSKNKQFFVVFTSCFNQEELEEFRGFIRGRCKHIEFC
ncbi:MAG: YcxB family protein [Clostridium sp.]